MLPPSKARAQNLANEGLVPSLYSTSEAFDEAISRERITLLEPLPVTGITVPHHLLAADLIARGFWAASGNSVDRIIIISPNHFRKDGPSFTTSLRGFQTVFGAVENDVAGTTTVIGSGLDLDLFELFDHEHGAQALLPFVKWFFPNATTIPIAVSSRSTRDDWDAAVRCARTLA